MRGYGVEALVPMCQADEELDQGRAAAARRAGRVAQAYSPRQLTAGEAWTVEALAQVRRRGYRPAAWWRFIGSSVERAALARQDRPGLTRQARVWGLAGAAAYMAANRAADRLRKPAPRPRAGLAWWAAVWKMLDWHLGMAEGDDGVPRERLSAADAATLSRFWLVPFLHPLRSAEHGFVALIVAAGASDWADGALARAGGRTRLGRDLDTTADLAFILTAAAAATRAGRLPAPAAWALAGRNLAGILVALAGVLGRARRPAIRARPWGGALRFGGLAIAAAGLRRPGAALVIAGCIVPPRSTAPWLSPA